jgi:prepilin-type N-terminal cleavage/methylation domain-containing protein
VVTRRRCRGFTLIECAVALVVLSIVATTVAATGTSELRYFARSHEETVAERAAAACIERLAAAATAPATGSSAFELDAETSRQLPAAVSTQRVTLVEPGLLRVEAEVTWQAADGGTARVRVATLLAREAPR